MAKPENVLRSQAFILSEVIYNQDDFSIATGYSIGSEEIHLAMRWNGGENGVGFPRAFNHSLWFPINKELTKSILLGLKNHQNNCNEVELMKIHEVIEQLQ